MSRQLDMMFRIQPHCMISIDSIFLTLIALTALLLMAPKRKRQAAAATHPSNSPPPLPENVSSSPPSTPIAGRRLWKKDFDESKAKWAKGKGELVGCAGMIGVIERMSQADSAHDRLQVG